MRGLPGAQRIRRGNDPNQRVQEAIQADAPATLVVPALPHRPERPSKLLMRRPDEAYASTGDDRQVLSADEGLAAALSRLETILDRSGAAIVPLFHPGIGQPEVLAAFDGIGLTPSAEVLTWFGWHNGAGGPGMPTTLIELVPGGSGGGRSPGADREEDGPVVTANTAVTAISR